MAKVASEKRECSLRRECDKEEARGLPTFVWKGNQTMRWGWGREEEGKWWAKMKKRLLFLLCQSAPQHRTTTK